MEALNRIMKAILITAFVTRLVLSQQPKCFQDPFPKFMGAPGGGKIQFQSMDVSAATGAISVGGWTDDASLRGTSPNGLNFPFVVFYEPEKL